MMPACDIDTHLVQGAVSNYYALFNSTHETDAERVQ